MLTDRTHHANHPGAAPGRIVDAIPADDPGVRFAIVHVGSGTWGGPWQTGRILGDGDGDGWRWEHYVSCHATYADAARSLQAARRLYERAGR